MKELKIGDDVWLDSPRFMVERCLARVSKVEYNGGKYLFKILDDTVFQHGRFRDKREHIMEDGDTYVPYNKQHFNEELFVI